MKGFNLLLVLFLSMTIASELYAVSIENHEETGNEITLEEGPQLMVVKFHADWCGSCRALGQVLTDLSNKLDGQSVLFTELNFTNITTKNQTLLLAAALGIDEIVDKNQGTGFILVIDTKTKQVKAKLDKTQSVKEMGKIISNLL